MLWLRCGDELIEICGVVLTPPARQFLPLYNHEMGKHNAIVAQHRHMFVSTQSFNH